MPRSASPPLTQPPTSSPRARKRTLTSSTAASNPRPRRTSPSMSSATGFTVGSDVDDEEEWEGVEEVRARRRKKKDEPMSPVAVVFYVISLYLVFQILTRSDDHEILSHLPAPLRPSSSYHDGTPHPAPYHLPYHLPQLPSSSPSALSTPAPEKSTSVLGWLVYPIYLLITLLATPLPLLLNGLNLLLLVLNTVLYPITSTLRLLTRTFLVGPASILIRIGEALYPVGSFVAGVVGVGCVMGAGAGYAGKAVVDLLTGKKRRKTKRPKSDRTKSSSSLSSKNHDRNMIEGGNVGKEKEIKATGQGSMRIRPTRSPSSGSSGDVPFTPTAAIHPKLFPDQGTRKVRARAGTGDSEGRASRDEGAVTGVRRRTSHLGR